MRIGILGGSFNPIHYGHLLMAENCREACRLDAIWFIPAAVSPYKTGQPSATATARLEMAQLAVAGNPQFHVSEIEIERGGISYTVETLSGIHASQPEAELFFLMGADSLVDFPSWRDPQRICQLATPVVVRRYGTDEPDWQPLRALVDEAQWQRVRAFQTDMPRVEISSSDIRARIADQRSIRYMTPRAVEKYIETHRLYVGAK
ncbi:MAG: nicotinate-nucleotide adenylyltransferase [Planctomycetales bacterium]|nr:nicotinate-nucleotide adenylyltransferase [Planctomycetales bacterium]